MKEEIYKYSLSNFECSIAEESSPIDLKFSDNPVINKYGYFSISKTSTTEKDYIENYSNLLASVQRSNEMVVLEKNENKVSLKIYESGRFRRFGVCWFRVHTKCTFYTFDMTKGDFYHGFIENYHKKRKVKKYLRKNYFASSPYNMMCASLNNVYSENKEQSKDQFREMILSKLFTVLGGNETNTRFCDSWILENYLQKKNVKYPNNFRAFIFSHYGTAPNLKEIKKSNMKLVDAFMKKNGLFGETIKKILHTQKVIGDTKFLSDFLKVFPHSWIFQDQNFVEKALSLQNYYFIGFSERLENLDKIMSKIEFKNVFLCFKDSILNHMIDLSSVTDHIEFYRYLNSVGEKVKWKSKNFIHFKDEHLDWADKYEHYKRGNYTRIYPNSLDESLKIPIIDGDDVYYPILLKNSTEYNSESQIQNNCVKGYIGRPSSLIISLRKNSTISEDRATVEFQIFKEKEKVKFNRPQSLGKYNNRLDGTWNVPLKKLDERIDSWVKSQKEFVTVKLEKEIIHNGMKLYSDSDWMENGFLFWTYNVINKDIYSNYHLNGLQL